jgi:anti-anti-sigma regulatory factor
MPLTLTSSDSGIQATIVGEFTINTVEELRDDLFGLLNLPEVDLDLTQLTEFDGNALQLVVLLVTEARRKHNQIRLAPVNAKVQESMALLGFDQPVPDLPRPHHGP